MIPNRGRQVVNNGFVSFALQLVDNVIVIAGKEKEPGTMTIEGLDDILIGR